jgi:hypothetical protein
VNNASGLTQEIKTFMERTGIIRQNAEVVDEVFVRIFLFLLIN